MSEALKYDDNKPMLSLVPYEAIELMARVLMFGAKKYGVGNWRKGMAHTRFLDAALRHVYAYIQGQDTDAESGLSHLGHAMTCLAFLVAYREHNLGSDDRSMPLKYQALMPAEDWQLSQEELEYGRRLAEELEDTCPSS